MGHMTGLVQYRAIPPRTLLDGSLTPVSSSSFPLFLSFFLCLPPLFLFRREASAKLIFYTIQAEGVELQIFAEFKQFGMTDASGENSFVAVNHSINRGDVIGTATSTGFTHLRASLSSAPPHTLSGICFLVGFTAHMPIGCRLVLAI